MTTKKTILLCEDEEFVARSYKRRLELEGYSVIHAHNGQEALDLMRSELPDLVILDLMMPVKSGFEVLEERLLDADKKVLEIPILIASNLGQKSDIAEAERLGAVGFIVKSNISLKDLMIKVQSHMSS